MASGERLPSDPPPPNPSTPKAFSLSLGTSKPKPPPLSRRPLAPSSALKDGTKRRHVTTLSDSEEEDTAGTVSQPQLVSAFDHSAGGAIGADKVEEDRGPLVIPSQKNRDWREESKRKRGKNLLPPEVQQARAGGTVGGIEGDVVNGGVQAYGLTFVERTMTGKDGDVKMTTEPALEAERQVAQSRTKTDDELALEALTSDNRAGRNSSLTLPTSEARQDTLDYSYRVRTNHISEDDAYRLDVASRPDPASLEDYAAVPVEEFGAALLRGMGWKEGDVVGKRKDQVSKPRVVERRPALLGIGAKEVPGGVGEELGAWGKGVKNKKGRATDKIYNPVVLKNSKTGEMLTEEELKAKKEEYERAKREKGLEEDWRERRDRNLGRDLERKEGRNGSRGSSRTYNRSSDRDNHHHSHHHRRDRDSRDYHQESGSSRDRSARRERSRSSHRRRRDGDDEGEKREMGSRDRRRREDGERGERERDRRRRGGDESGGSPSRRGHQESGGYEEEKSRRRQEVF
ncbi:hypothetical protein FGG08_002197 [Glutinoglossum americanum]|uniref:Pre-mRNA-splicing factor n=1 Tax=Glutinoglossum americanum TaxID=1670608 RepID=A0A9P8IC58_9PEZI|nr:hypothetical protein FGG08_002197 [Glutinoglossum americanum]